MQAITFDRYTGPDGLTLTDQPVPEPGPGQVLVKVSAAALNAFDWHQYRGDPRFLRLQAGLRVKEPRTVGADFAGVVEAIGAGVEAFAVGDRVIAEAGFGGCAEYAVAGVDAVARIPDSVDFQSAAATVMGGLTALQALRDKAALAQGERVLVWGASGGVGHLAVQAAQALGASSVDAVCSGKNATMVKELGATRVFDYTAEDVTGETYDVILDTVSTATMRSLRGLLTATGRVVTVGAVGGGPLLGPLGPFLRRLLASKTRRVDSRVMLASANPEDLGTVAAWLGDGRLSPVIQQVYPLADTAQACQELEAGHVAGKLVIAVE